ncbi:hypothetical protein PV08_11846 [Exophiala spinifera]|uniref:Methyltransferase domain-containing protein n=1 Tax=Exophiala spinifera TaxID=91928 RepID=A0A0D2AUC8_9EURO|nr:uncharacterized protein PV08_11846 [Exophiala spinifera]KIW10070.1 hypothetical protein PV08_11846 [Exophiala spinifera]
MDVVCATVSSCSSASLKLSSGFPSPIDDGAQDDHLARHLLFQEVLQNRTFCAPVNLENGKVLDLYTRTGKLAVDIADENPSCSVTGVDESLMHDEWVPSNLVFEIADIENEDWTWKDRFRLVIYRGPGGFTKNLSRLLRRCFESLEDQGYVEFQLLALDPQSHREGPRSEESKIRDLHRRLSEGLSATGRELNVHHELPRQLQKIGFHNIEHKKFAVPLGKWPKDPRLVILFIEENRKDG